MIDQRRGTGEESLGYVVASRRPQGLLVQGSIEPPPDALQDLQEALRRLLRGGHAEGRQTAVDVRVCVDPARLDSSLPAVEA